MRRPACPRSRGCEARLSLSFARSSIHCAAGTAARLASYPTRSSIDLGPTRSRWFEELLAAGVGRRHSRVGGAVEIAVGERHALNEDLDLICRHAGNAGQGGGGHGVHLEAAVVQGAVGARTAV